MHGFQGIWSFSVLGGGYKGYDDPMGRGDVILMYLDIIRKNIYD